ncbi:TatD family hydrolase [Salinispira pacifica]|uniref:Putative deoxyribonuclease YcfH n=1 Tax=Salinispira pacifica TaxID=1307761 RepID=V5WGM2_9SPIO|nr:TatD family hydrolase [Salinispira pacifica]AHC14977.1 Putative deoxyribonuclease YcfH [Salinispira pacifica]
MRSAILDAHLHTQDTPDSVFSGYLRCISCSAGTEDWQELAANRDPRVHPYAGIHPAHIRNKPDGRSDKKQPAPRGGDPRLRRLRELLESRPDMGVGEIGMDRSLYSRVSRQLQEEYFSRQLQIALEYHRPAVLHVLNCAGAAAEVLERNSPDIPIMLHSWYEHTENLKRFLKFNCYFSVGPGGHWKHRRTWEGNARKSSSAHWLKAIPMDRLLIESDWPHGSEREDGHTSHSQLLLSMYERVAAILEIDRDELIDIVLRNGKVFTDFPTHR